MIHFLYVNEGRLERPVEQAKRESSENSAATATLPEPTSLPLAHGTYITRSSLIGSFKSLFLPLPVFGISIGQ